MELLGIDNVFFEVANLNEAIDFYIKLGFSLKFKISHANAALFNIGNEEPGLILVETKEPKPSRLWVEVSNAIEAQKEMSYLNGKTLEAATGITYEIADPWGNVVGFADYTKKPELGRRKKN